MVNRREILKCTLISAVGACTVQGQEAEEAPATQATTFDPKRQFELPGFAFRQPLVIPRVPRPTFVGNYGQCDAKSVFGQDDQVAIGACFHGVAAEFGETPKHWKRYGCDSALKGAAAWDNKRKHFGEFDSHDLKQKIKNWNGFPIKCYKVNVVPSQELLRPDAKHKARIYTYAGILPGPTFKMRIGQPVVIRYANHLDTEISIHLHGGHSPSHSDGFPSFYVLPGKSRDYFYPNILPMQRHPDPTGDETKDTYTPDMVEAQSTMWYHDHAMDATAYNVSKGLAGFAPCFGELELKLINEGVLPGLGADSCFDPDLEKLSSDPTLEDPNMPGFYMREKEPYYNPYDIPLAIQDKLVDLESGQIIYENKGHNGYLGDTMFVNGVAWPHFEVENRKYRFRLLDGSNARILRLRLLKYSDFEQLHAKGIDDVGAGEDDPVVIAKRPERYEALSQEYLRIGKDSWLWSHALKRKSIVLAMANRADVVIDFGKLVGRDLEEGETAEFVLVNTMPQTDGRGPKQKLDDGGDPRVLPVPFDVVNNGEAINLAESRRPIGLIKFIVKGKRPEKDASVEHGTELIDHPRIPDDEVRVVREFIFERGKGAWQINSRFYDPAVANATPSCEYAEEWVLRNGGGGWWHPIHIHLESHQLVRYEKDFEADAIVDTNDPPAVPRLGNLVDITKQIEPTELQGLHDTTVLGPNTVARIRMRFRTWRGPFVFHCHNLEHEDMRMMFNFEPVPEGDTAHRRNPNMVPDARTHGQDVTLDGKWGELPYELPPVPKSTAKDNNKLQIPARPKP